MIQTNLTSSCNMDCSCSNNDLEPICGINGITYFSPCHAGCTTFYSSITPSARHMVRHCTSTNSKVTVVHLPKLYFTNFLISSKCTHYNTFVICIYNNCAKTLEAMPLMLQNFSGCSCIMENQSFSPEVIMSPVAQNGPCESSCNNLLPFLVVLVLVTFTVAGTQMPLLMVTLR